MVYDIDYRVGPEYISPSREGQIPILIHATQQVLSDYLRYTFMITFHSVTFDDLKALMV
jgi:hypothetical protein